MRAIAALQFHGPLRGRLSAERAQNRKRVVQIPGDYMHGKIFAESSRHGRVRGTDVDLRVAELQLARALIVVDGERTAAPAHRLRPGFRSSVAAGADSRQARKA